MQRLWACFWILLGTGYAQTLTGPSRVLVGDPVFLRLANGTTPVEGVTVQVTAPARELGTVLNAVNFRESAGGRVFGVVYRGERVLVKGQTGDGWCEVIVAYGATGYVACDYLEREPFGQPLGVTDLDGRVVILNLSLVPGPITVSAGSASFTLTVAPAVDDVTTVLASGITHRVRRWVREGEGLVAMQIVEVDPAEPNVFILPVRARDAATGRATTSSMSSRYGAIAAVNGGPFAADGTSTAGYRLNGQTLATVATPRTSLLRCADGSLQVDLGTVAGACAPQDIVGGGPRLVTGGRVDLGTDTMGNEGIRAPRTAVALTQRGTYLFVTLDGRQALSAGLRAEEFAAELVALGATRAVALDGGASTTMVVDDTVRNSPSDGAERQVSDAVLVCSVHDLESLRHMMDRVALDPGQMAATAIEPLYQRLDNAGAAFAADELETVRLEVEALRAEIQKRSGGELTVAAARVLTEAANAYLRLLPGIQQALSRRR